MENKLKNNKTFVQKMFSFFGIKGKKEQKVLKKSFNAARNSRLKTSFFSVSTGSDVNSDIFTDGYQLMKIAREFEKNNAYVRKYLNAMVNNVVGPTGFNLSVKGYDYKPELKDGKTVYNKVYDEFASNLVAENFWEWTKKKYCDLSKTFSFNEICELTVRQLFRDGEVLIIKHKGGKELNKWGFALQLINIERLDRKYNGINPKNGNRIVMSVELDENNRKVAFYLQKTIVSAVPGINQKLDGSNYTRIEANDCIYLYKATDAEQIRGYSPLVAGLETLENLEGYQEAELINARASAGKMGFFISNEQEVNQLDIADREDDDGNFISEVEPGTFHVLPKGYDFKENNPNYPQSYDKFIKANLRTVASAFNISYEDLSNDRESVNYSSIRAGLVQDREIYKAIQNFLIENMLDDIYEDWLKNAILNKAIVFPNGAILQFEKFEKFKQHQFRGRGFAWVDPLKDITASIEAVKFGLSSRKREAEKLGIDLNEVFDELAEEKLLAESKGLNLENSENIMATINQVNNISSE